MFSTSHIHASGNLAADLYANVAAESAYAFVTTSTEDGPPPPAGRWSAGPSIDGKGTFRTEVGRPLGDEPVIFSPAPPTFPRTEQSEDGPGRSPLVGSQRPSCRAAA